MSTDRDGDTLDAALLRVDLAADPTDLFGPLPEGDVIPPAATAAYRRLARRLHPDTAPPGRRAAAAEGFTRLTEAWRRYRETVLGGLGPNDLVLTTPERTYHVDRGRPLAEGDVATLRTVRYRDGEAWRSGVLKLPRAPRDNDLLRAEAAALRRIDERGDPRLRAFAPRLVEAMRHRDPVTRVERHGNVLDRLAGFHTLAEVRSAHPDGLDPRDAAWMWRRILVAIGNAHRAGVVHGAVVPEHVLIHPEDHGLVLVDWCYAVTFAASGTAPHVPAMVPHRRDLYPPEVAARRPARPATDVYMATRCVEYVTAGRLPRELRAFARGSALPAPERRPSDAFALLGELDEALERVFGPRRFRPFSMPAA
ncbi:lipopolysaccharide kinase InaA family protein [Nocardiopsis sp. MG754419]|uniref:lipopolysaccharide kinase InaA family protein n=1 Tax=Nocardiopsis sp. MG754419 TaxID=2259865 RepID=UPI001BA477F2|nr:lipopolysaccharide kinase InaA family protein [Nocardiopsis sp. MG754419]MBR8741622.1 molecular chaperone DnaJ [Nocardiopsis sp. MG754419]